MLWCQEFKVAAWGNSANSKKIQKNNSEIYKRTLTKRLKILKLNPGAEEYSKQTNKQKECNGESQPQNWSSRRENQWFWRQVESTQISKRKENWWNLWDNIRDKHKGH